jgi:hypothetical protein
LLHLPCLFLYIYCHSQLFGSLNNESISFNSSIFKQPSV